MIFFLSELLSYYKLMYSSALSDDFLTVSPLFYLSMITVIEKQILIESKSILIT